MKWSPDAKNLLGGIGDGRLYLNGVIPPGLETFHAGGWDWIDNDWIGGQGGASETEPWTLHKYNIRTHEFRALDPDHPAAYPLSAGAATDFFAAGSGRWLAYLAARPPVSYDSDKQQWSDRVAFGMSPEGVELFTNGDHNGLLLRHPNGAEESLPLGPVFSAQMREDIIMWCGIPLTLHAIGAPDPQCPKSGGPAARFTVMPDGRKFIVQWCGGLGALVVYEWRARTADALLGWALSYDGFNFDHDIAVRGRDLVIGVGVNAGETMQRVYALNPDTGVCVLPDGTTQMLPLTNLDQPAVVMPQMGPFNHPVTVAVFKDPNGDTEAPYEVLVNMNDQTKHRPVIVADNTLVSKRVGPLFGVYGEGAGDDARSTIAKADMLKTRAIWCHDAIMIPTIPPTFRPWDQFWVELYRDKNETLAQTVARWDAQVRFVVSHWGGDIGVIPMFYCQGGPSDPAPGEPPEVWTVAEVEEGLAFLTQIVNINPRIKMIAPFEYLRRNGITAHPELLETFKQLLIAAFQSGTPVFREIIMVPPLVQVDSFTLDELKNGREFVGHDPQNPSLGTRCRVWVENGSVFMEIAYPGLGPGYVGRTGKARPFKQ